MKQRDLILGLGFLGAFTMAAQSPYTGSVAPTEGSGDFYLYQVESGKWLQNNTTRGHWTTRAGLDKDGFDVEVKVIEGGYQLNPKLTGNGSINGEGLYMDTGRPVTTWGLIPVTVDGVSNAYNIQMISCDVADQEQYLLGEADGLIADQESEGQTWQLVSRADRISHMKAEVANGPVDASWLIPGGDFSRNDLRSRQWVYNIIGGSGVGISGSQHNSLQEAWDNSRYYVHYIVLNDIPNGTYKFTPYGYYREDWESQEAWDRYNNNETICRAQYFAGESIHNFMHPADPGFTDKPDYEGVEGDWRSVEALGGNWIPNCTTAGSTAILAGIYKNEPIEAVVTDGTLVLGVVKYTGDYHDWVAYDNFRLEYVNTDTPAVDLTKLVEELNAQIVKVEALPQTPASQAALTAAREALTSSKATELRKAVLDLIVYEGALSEGARTINNFNATLEFMGGADVSYAMELFNTASSKGDFENALKHLRFARRRAAAHRHADVFKGSEPAPGEFYLYNVGQKQFLCGGSDWGAHASLGMPGIPIILEEENAEDMTYHFDTQLYNGDTKHYMNYRGYMDCDKAGAWRFVPVEGKENVYRIVQNDYPDAIVCYNINASVDDGGAEVRDETTVGTETRNFNGPEEDAQWKLVSREEREALMETATLNNPIDATFYLSSPGFNQRENVEDWSFTNTKVCDRGSRRSNFVVEAWDSEEFDVSQVVTLPEGVYSYSVNAFYRNGHHVTEVDSETGEVTVAGQPDQEKISNAIMYATFDPAFDHHIMNILEESGKAPGQGADVKSLDGVTYHYPQYTDQASDFFRNGLYKNETFFYTDGSDCNIGIMQDPDMMEWLPRHWMVCDNFRLKYFGNNTTVEEVKAGIDEVVADDVNSTEFKGDNRIFNLQGIQVKSADAPGIYIQNGKKFVVR